MFVYSHRYNDPPYLKVKKLELLTEVCTTDNARNIVDELGYENLIDCQRL